MRIKEECADHHAYEQHYHYHHKYIVQAIDICLAAHKCITRFSSIAKCITSYKLVIDLRIEPVDNNSYDKENEKEYDNIQSIS